MLVLEQHQTIKITSKLKFCLLLGSVSFGSDFCTNFNVIFVLGIVLVLFLRRHQISNSDILCALGMVLVLVFGLHLIIVSGENFSAEMVLVSILLKAIF